VSGTDEAKRPKPNRRTTMRLTNSFHNTRIETRKTMDDLTQIAEAIGTGRATAAEKQYQRRVWNTLCGIKGCLCGDTFGRR
jgi:hypothetical protein